MIRHHLMPYPKNSARRMHNAGFTLLELLFGMAIFSIGTLAIAGLQTHSVNMNSASRRQLEIEAHVGRIVEFYQDLPWTELNSPVGATPAVIDNVDVDGILGVEVLPVLDVDGDDNTTGNGLNDTGAAADYLFNATSGGIFTPIRPGDPCQVFVNVARDVTIPNTLTINIIAQWTQLGQTKNFNVLFVKGRDV